MSDYCEAYIWLQEQQCGVTESVQIRCWLPAGHQKMHMNTELNGYCRKPHNPILMWEGDDGEEDKEVPP